MSTLWQLVGEVLTMLVVLVLAVTAVTEFIGARVPGFLTISDATRLDVARGDYRLFVAVLAAFLVGALWWALHILLRL